ncbi:ribonuclease HII [Kineococcus sp. T90]|nr:ribonuclease HII [Kineococcus indalonis]
MAGVDEVGRGALAGPVSVGVLVVDAGTPTAPRGLRDSKLLSPAAREALVPALREWAVAWAVGHAAADEVDALGVTAALRLAGRRALAQLPAAPSVVLLDGSHDWLSDPPAPPPSPPALLELPAPAGAAPPELPCPAPPVTTRVKADLTCAAVAGASVLAKTARDALMARLHAQHPHYGWDANKGYGAPGHLAALAEHGRCAQHRRSWRLPAAALPAPRAVADADTRTGAPGPAGDDRGSRRA